MALTKLLRSFKLIPTWNQQVFSSHQYPFLSVSNMSKVVGSGYHQATRTSTRDTQGENVKVIDFRSDTVTKPDLEMRQAMMNAEVGDDVYREDPTINELEAKAAKLLGKEASLFVPSGTMSNLIALLVHCKTRGSEVIVGDEAHILHYEQAGASQFGGISLRPVRTLPNGTMDMKEIQQKIRDPSDPHHPITSLICVENTHNRRGGRVVPLDWLKELHDFARGINLKLHLDGARLFNAAVALGVPASDIASYFDSVSICLSKGLGAPVGSLLVGTEVIGSEKWSTKSGPMDRSWPADGPSIHEDKFPHSRDRAREVETYHGEVLRLYRVGRRMMGAYMCIANNDLPPAVSKRVSLNVNFAPTVKSETQLLGAPIGSEIKLICHVEAYPQSINFWTKGHHTDNTMLLSSKKYRIDEERMGYNCIMSLTIRDFNLEDENTYKCVATNSLGDAEASIRLYKIKTETQKSPVLAESFYTTGATQSARVLVRKNDKDLSSRIHKEDISPSSSGMKDQRQSSNYIKQQANFFPTNNAVLPISNGFLLWISSLVIFIYRFLTCS